MSDIQGREERIGKGGEIVISAGQKDMLCFCRVQEECFLPGALASPYGWALWEGTLCLDLRAPLVEIPAAIILYFYFLKI